MGLCAWRLARPPDGRGHSVPHRRVPGWHTQARAGRAVRRQLEHGEKHSEKAWRETPQRALRLSPRRFAPRPGFRAGAHPTASKTRHIYMNQRSLLTEGLVPHAQNSEERADLPLTFATILADPPWDVFQRGGRGAHRHYPLMTTEKIAALPVGKRADTDASRRRLPDQPDVLSAVRGSQRGPASAAGQQHHGVRRARSYLRRSRRPVRNPVTNAAGTYAAGKPVSSDGSRSLPF
jgi:hypothetical protein